MSIPDFGAILRRAEQDFHRVVEDLRPDSPHSPFQNCPPGPVSQEDRARLEGWLLRQLGRRRAEYQEELRQCAVAQGESLRDVMLFDEGEHAGLTPQEYLDAYHKRVGHKGHIPGVRVVTNWEVRLLELFIETVDRGKRYLNSLIGARERHQAETDDQSRREDVATDNQRADERAQALWRFVPGGFFFNGRRYELRGVPLQVLRAFVDRRDSMTAKELADAIGTDMRGTSPATIGRHVSTVRGTLRDAVRDDGLELKNPLPCVEQGRTDSWQVAWQLELPT